jgi:hypothetical protein
MALTATLRAGSIMGEVTKILGLSPGRYHLIRRSNMRHDIQIIFRELKSSLASHSFPELDWILDEGDNTVIFCKTISLGFRVAAYLWRQAKVRKMARIDRRIRLFNSLNWPTYNLETLGFLNNNEDSSITIATDTLSVGWDSKYTRNAVLLGERMMLTNLYRRLVALVATVRLFPIHEHSFTTLVALSKGRQSWANRLNLGVRNLCRIHEVLFFGAR